MQTDRVLSAFETEFKPGAGGWPTHRYFNWATGFGGKPFQQKTDKRICDELGDVANMINYVSEMAGVYICDARTGKHCTPKERAYAAEWKTKTAEEAAAELAALDATPQPDAVSEQQWLGRQRSILSQLAQAVEKDEL